MSCGRGALSLAVVVFVAGLGVGCRGRPRSWDLPTETERPRATGPAVLEFDLTGGAPESTPKGLLQIPSRHTFDALVGSLHQASTRKDLKGILVTFGAAPLGWARARELGEGLAAFKARGVPVVCHADAWDNGAYAAAARGCDTILVSPAGEVEVTGPAATVPYARELLVDKLKAQVDILQVGKFKGAAEPLTRDGPSEEYRQSIEGALSAITTGFREALAVRGLGDLVGTGPYAAEESKAKRLVDELGDRKAARELVKSKTGNSPVQVAFGPGSDGPPRVGIGDLVRILSQRGGEATARPHVRLVRLHGEISLGEGAPGPLGGSSGIVARRLVERANELAEDGRVRAVVLRIDSPGGSALGSDLAWISLFALRAKKPLIVSIGEMAASGGYYLSCAGTKIFAEPESIVGSVGVVGGKVSFEGTLAMAGVHTASFGDPRAARMASLTSGWDDDTRARLLETMREVYGLFLRRIAEGRGRARESFDPAVEGRVFGGARAKELGMVDELGGLGAALAEAKRAAGLDEGAPVVVDDTASFFEILSDGDDLAAGPWGAWLRALAAAPFAPEEREDLRIWLRSFANVTTSAHPRNVATILPLPLLVR
jgi:protease-4